MIRSVIKAFNRFLNFFGYFKAKIVARDLNLYFKIAQLHYLKKSYKIVCKLATNKISEKLTCVLLRKSSTNVTPFSFTKINPRITIVLAFSIIKIYLTAVDFRDSSTNFEQFLTPLPLSLRFFITKAFVYCHKIVNPSH